MPVKTESLQLDSMEQEAQKPKETNSYRSMLKGTTVFGGLQIFQLAVNLIRGKFVAMFLGPTGMGISSLFQTSGQTIQQLSQLGLNFAVVKEVASNKEDEVGLHAIRSVTARLLFWSAVAGALLCCLFSVPLSRITFGTPDYYWQFMLLSLMIFFGVAGQGYTAILQGLHKYKMVTLTLVVGSLTGLLIGVPMYAVWGYRGIVPAMVVLSFSVALSAFIGVRKVLGRNASPVDRKQRRPIAKKLLLLGLILMSSELMVVLCNYLINLFIRWFGPFESVGLYQAANSLTNQYSGLVFMAMLLDFFPRLSAAAQDNGKIREIVNRQLEMVGLIATPLICLLIFTSPLIIQILLTDDFMSIMELMRWMGLGVLVKAIMTPMGYIAFAKDNKKLLFWLEAIFCNLLTLGLNCLFYYLFGLIGLGYALVIDCTICLAIYYFVNRRLYDYNFDGKSLRESVTALLIGGGCFAASLITDTAVSYTVMGAVTLTAILRSVVVLRRNVRG